MKILWIIDNKFRELYGLHDLKKNLLKDNIKLFLFDIPTWKSAIDFINPNIVVVPNLYSHSCGPIVKYAYKKNIDVFMHSSEGMFYTDEIQKDKYPDQIIKKIKKVLVWGKLDAKYLIKKYLSVTAPKSFCSSVGTLYFFIHPSKILFSFSCFSRLSFSSAVSKILQSGK